jgi:hypothetical protein
LQLMLFFDCHLVATESEHDEATISADYLAANV